MSESERSPGREASPFCAGCEPEIGNPSGGGKNGLVSAGLSSKSMLRVPVGRRSTRGGGGGPANCPVPAFAPNASDCGGPTGDFDANGPDPAVPVNAFAGDFELKGPDPAVAPNVFVGDFDPNGAEP